MENSLLLQIQAQFSEHFGIDAARLSPEAEIADLGIDSLAMIEFMFLMEDRFHVRMADSRAPLRTVADVVAEVERTLRQQRAVAAA
jgi:acyl carrier protein